jgi:hypothetical protein
MTRLIWLARGGLDRYKKKQKSTPRGAFSFVKETKSRHRRVWNPPVAVWNQSEAMNGIKPTNMQPQRG